MSAKNKVWIRKEYKSSSQTKTYVSSINKDLIVDDIFIVINFYYNILTVGKTIILQIVKSSRYEKEYSCLE